MAATSAIRSHLHMTAVDADVVVDVAGVAVKAIVDERAMTMRRVLTMRCSSISEILLVVVISVHRFPPIAMLPIVTSSSTQLAEVLFLT